ncbi:MAG: stage III sporulation protein AE [Oscillospiraceae bacterium]|nr:stage III sporulation protein AE [Oscillospiraceae bacterium]
MRQKQRGPYWVCLLLMILFLPRPSVSAQNLVDWKAVSDGIPESAEELLEGISPEELTPEQAARRMIGAFSRQAGGAVRDTMGQLALLLSVILICGVCGTLGEAARAQGETLNIAAAVAVTTICAGGLGSLIGRAGAAIADMNLLAKTLMPAMAALQAAMGWPGGAVARHSATMLFSALLSGAVSGVMFPLTYVYILLLAVNTAMPRPTLERLAVFLKKSVTFVLTAGLALFVAYFTVSGTVAGSADAFAVKSAKAGIGAAVPVVGAIIAEASEALLLGGGILKNALGLYGILAVAGICLEPVLGLLARWVLFKLGAALSAPLADERVSRLLDGLSDAFGMVMGMTAACAFLLFTSVISMMMTGQS